MHLYLSFAFLVNRNRKKNEMKNRPLRKFSNPIQSDHMHKNQPNLTDMDGVDRFFLCGLHIPYFVKIEIPKRKKKKTNMMAG